MSYPGWGFLIVLGVAIGSVIYYYFNESNGQQQYTNENTSSERRRRRRSNLREENCTICLELLDGFRKIRTLPCGHAFHEHCIAMWLNRKNLCPVCRVAV